MPQLGALGFLYCYQCTQRLRRQSAVPVTSERYCATDRSRMRAQEGLEGEANGSVFL